MYCLWHETDTTLLNSCTCEIEMLSKKTKGYLDMFVEESFQIIGPGGGINPTDPKVARRHYNRE